MRLIDVLMPALVSSVVGAILVTVLSLKDFGASAFIFGVLSFFLDNDSICNLAICLFCNRKKIIPGGRCLFICGRRHI